MTLIVAIPARRSVIFGSDTQVTTGVVRARGTKIHKLNEQALWGASGELALIQRVQERVAGMGALANQPLLNLRDSLAMAIKDSVNALLQTDFRTQFFVNSPDQLLSLHLSDFLFVECRHEQPTVLHAAGTRPDIAASGHVVQAAR